VIHRRKAVGFTVEQRTRPVAPVARFWAEHNIDYELFRLVERLT
jgi:hypothetical protein